MPDHTIMHMQYSNVDNQLTVRVKVNGEQPQVKLFRYSVGHAPCYMYFLLMYVTVMY